MIKIYYLLLKFLGKLSQIYFCRYYTAGKKFNLHWGGGIVGNKDKIIIGDNNNLFGWLISDGGKIKIGDNTVIHKKSIIRSMSEVLIGDYCDIGGEVYIQDHNSMSLNYIERRNHQSNILSKHVKIGNDVWIGRRSMILKGVTIGDRSIIGAGSVVTHDVPADSIAAGNPAVIAKSLINKK